MIDPAVVPIEKARGTSPAGTTGVQSYGGYVSSGESSTALNGKAKWLTYSNAINMAVVATGVRYFGNLLAGTEWHAEAPPDSGEAGKRAVDIVTKGLLEAPLPRTWPMIVRKAAMFRFMGFSLHATSVARRPDGMIVYADIQHRPQHTIEQWLRDNEQSPFTSVVQMSPTMKEYPIELSECFYCVDDLLTDGPEGIGLLRHVIELVRRLGLFEGLEGSGYFQDIAGLPIARAPLEEIAIAAGGTDVAKVKSAIMSATSTLQAAVANRVQTPEKLQWLMLDSGTFKADAGTPSGIKKWDIEVVKGEPRGLADLNTTIGRVGLEIARVLGIEFAMVGGGDSAGSYGMHEDKTSMFATNLQTTITEIGHFAKHQLARRLVALNGLDPATCTPNLVAEPISTEAIETVTRSLANLALAGLAPNDPARDVMRRRMRLPPEPDADASMTLDRKSPRATAAGAKGQEPSEPTGMPAVNTRQAP